jgi:DNA polymerase-1
MGPYAENDCIITARLYKKLMRELRDEVAGVWQTEIGLTRKLLEAQINGVRVDWVLLKHTYRDMLRRIMVVQEEMDKIAGREVEYGSEEEVNDLFVNQLGIQPVSYTDTGKNQWDSNAMDIIDHPIAPWFKEYSHLFHFTNTYCKGWIERRGDDDRLHPSFKQAGARTGRLSAVDPNFHNVMAEAEVFVIPEEGEVILGADYSQIEYRLFAHYANDEKILSKYRQDPNTDYHQALADLLGVDRQFAKSLNFAFLYGMGKDKLLKMIAGICAVNASDVNMADKMRSFLTGSGTSAANKARAMDLSSFTEIASNIYDKYHREVPTIRQLQRRVTNAVRSRGWLKNYCGRVYTIPPQAIYKGVNMLIQGSAADIFKGRLLALMEARPDMKLITNVHDSVFFSVARDGLEKALSDMILHLEDVPGVRVPLKIEAKVSGQNWGTCVKVSNDVWESVKKSEMVKKREWGKTA